MKQTNPQLLSSVTNALRLLKLFTLQTPEKRLTEIARELGIGKSTASRLLSTLLSEGFVYQDPVTHKYRLGQRIVTLYHTILHSHLDLQEAAMPVIERLAAETSEDLRIAVLEENEIVYIHQVGTRNPLDEEAFSGGRAPAFATGGGKLLLAYESESGISKVLSTPLKRYTPLTRTDPGELRDHLKVLRKQGYCVSVGEYRTALGSISAPIRDASGHVISVLTLIAASDRLGEKRISLLTSKVVKAAKEISRRFGYLK
ncbi:IclR family transcriptional regulator [Paenibacillus chitinolyticus]|uniref:IclR family transcriptional regulator n=1 Tax=Paenibacillus chitinolyticus TaxID=79263 RepID=UPI00366BB58D